MNTCTVTASAVLVKCFQQTLEPTEIGRGSNLTCTSYLVAEFLGSKCYLITSIKSHNDSNC
jgi:hypothetical protein